jgi:hypothetical protein
MVHWLSKTSLILVILFFADSILAQPATGGTSTEDYKDAKTHEKFRKRRQTVSAWQINQLKRGALVIRLKTNHMLINELKKRGEIHDAEKARMEQAAINLNMMRAFLNNYRFSKVYFIYSNSSDSLLNGTRSGIFVDTTLKVNPAITMKENFYLLGESDFVYNSSIGFVREDSAKYVTERGNPSSMEMPIVLKNKFGHQLKNPFPYTTGRFVFTKNTPSEEIVIGGKPVVYSVSNGTSWLRGDRPSGYMYEGSMLNLSIPRMMTYDVLSLFVWELNADLEGFYRGNGGFTENNKNYEDSKPYFY